MTYEHKPDTGLMIDDGGNISGIIKEGDYVLLATKEDIARVEAKLDAILEAFNQIGEQVGGAMSQLAEGGMGSLIKGIMGRD